jgi:hypothetical protein
MIWKRAALYMTAPTGEPGGGPFSRTFERQMKEGYGNGAALINLIWTTFWTQIMLGA